MTPVEYDDDHAQGKNGMLHCRETTGGTRLPPEPSYCPRCGREL